MAETNIWNISSTDDPELHYVTRNDPDDGNYIFTPPESGQITYKITYTNGSATGETIYVVKSTDCYVDPCQNNLNGPTVTFTSPEGATAKTVGSAASSVTVTYDLGECWKFISASRYGEPNNITSFRDSDGKIIYYAANNTTDKVQSDAIYKFRNYAANVTASSYVRIIQESKCASESAPTLSPLSIPDVPISGETYRNEIEFDVTECWYLKSVVTGANWVNLTDDYHTVVVSRNDDPSERRTDIVYTFENTEDSTKTTSYTVNVNQLADACIGDRDCPTITTLNYQVDIAGGNVTVNYTKSLGDCWTVTARKGTGDVDQITNIALGTKTKSTVSVKENTGERKEMTVIYTFTNTSNDTSCEKEITIVQERACVCTCEMIKRTGRDESYPYPLEGKNNALLKQLWLEANHIEYINRDIVAFSYTEGIEEGSLTIRESDPQQTTTIDGVTYKLIEIYGNLLPVDDARAVKFGIKACGQDCSEINPFYTYQRCFCGMDDCNNVYTLDGVDIYENRPLYISGCIGPDRPGGKFHGEADRVDVDSLYIIPKAEDGVTDLPRIKLFHKENGTFVPDCSTCDWADNPTTCKPYVTYNENGHALGFTVAFGGNRPMFGVRSLIGATKQPDGTWVEDPAVRITSEEHWDITFETDSTHIDYESSAWFGKPCCSRYQSTIYQAKEGYYYNKDKRDRNNKASMELCS